MTIADKARDAAIHCEMKKIAYRQTKDGIVVSFVLHPNEVPTALSTSHIGARYIAALVEIGDDEQPITPAAKEKPETVSHSFPKEASRDEPEKPHTDWRDLQPAAQAFLRGKQAPFWAFLNETRGYRITDVDEAAEAVREVCGVKSRSELGTKHAARVIWHQLDEEYLAWRFIDA